MNSKVKTDVKIIRKKEHGGERIYIYLPKGIKFFGRFRSIFCRFPGVGYFARIIYWDPELNAIVIVIPGEQDPDMFNDCENKRDDLYDTPLDEREDVIYACYGDYFVPVKKQ